MEDTLIGLFTSIKIRKGEILTILKDKDKGNVNFKKNFYTKVGIKGS